MSHFHKSQIHINESDAKQLKPLFQRLAIEHSLTFLEGELVSNRYEQVHMVLGLSGLSIPPVGLVYGVNKELRLAYDYELAHRNPTHEDSVAYAVVKELTEAIKSYKERKLQGDIQSMIQRHGASVNVIVHD